MSDQAQPNPNKVGTWKAPNGEMVDAVALPSMTSWNFAITVSIDGRVMPVEEALAFVYAQREWYKAKLADAKALIQQKGLELP